VKSLVIFDLGNHAQLLNLSEDADHSLSYSSVAMLICCCKGALVAYKASSFCLLPLLIDLPWPKLTTFPSKGHLPSMLVSSQKSPRPIPRQSKPELDQLHRLGRLPHENDS
jgi:hypothetical protein